MATIRLRGKSYRAEVARFGQRQSASFASYEDASEWASKVEDAILKAAGVDRWGPPPPPPSAIIAAKIEAAGEALSSADILAMPRFALSPGVYFLIKEDEIVYVGQSINVHARVVEHRACWKDFDSYTYVPCAVERLGEVERYYITTLRPRLNVSGLRL